MQRKKQFVYWLTILAMLMGVVGILPATAAVAPTAAGSATINSLKQLEAGDDDEVPPAPPGRPKGEDEEEDSDRPDERADAFYSRRTAGDPNSGFTMGQAANLRAQAATQVTEMLAQPQKLPAKPQAFGGAWGPIGPDPIIQVDRSGSIYTAQAGRIGALAIRSTPPYTIYLGAAQGGLWVSIPGSGVWTPKTDNLPSLATGAVALAPSNENIVYVGTGEGALSGDSYFGNGVLKSTDAGSTFFKVSANQYFTNVSISKIVVDPNNPDVLYAGTLRGRGGARRTSPPDASPFGVYKSTDGGINWTLVLTTSTNVLSIQKGVGDMAIDPQDPQVIYASIVGQGISKTVNGGATWTSIMNGLPANADYSFQPTRFALTLSRPTAAVSATLYTGFEWVDTSGGYHQSTVWKSTNDGGTWTEANTAVVGGYCGYNPGLTQCFYDNVVAADPADSNVVFAGGVWDYGGVNGAPDTSGGIYRSLDGGATWTDLGFGTHPDFHAVAFIDSATSGFTGTVVIGNDGGAWISEDYGGRLQPSDPIDAVTWVNLNGYVDPNTAAAASYGLQIAQFTSMDQHPSNNRAYGGTQDNGTLRKFNTAGPTPFYDFTSGDGGQVLVDQTDPNYVYGTYYGISPYRFTNGMSNFFTNSYIRTGINTNDRSDFYIPWSMDPGNPNRLYLGTYRVYRTDNAKAASASSVLWKAISGDLTSGCTGAASNGARGCVVSAVGKSAGSPALYVGTLEGWVWVTPDSTATTPVWQRLDTNSAAMPGRPVAAIAVDSSNYRVAYVGFNGFNAATPGQPGHVFKTTDAGQTWTDISSNLPDVPVNSIVIDPSYPNTIYLGTDVGPMVTTDNGGTWSPLGTGFPVTSIWQLNLNPFTRKLAAGTHGRGAWRLSDNTPVAALRISKRDAGVPVGPGSLLNYTLRVENWGNAQATGLVITDVVPANTALVAVGSGGTANGNSLVWNATSVPTATATGPASGLVPGSIEITFTVEITTANGIGTGSIITNDGYLVTSAQGPSAVGSPQYVVLAPAYAVSLAPTSLADSGRPSQVVTYTLTVKNQSFNADVYDLTVNGNNWTTTFWDSTFTTQITRTATLAAAGSTVVGVKVTIPAGVANATTDSSTIVATSEGDPAVTASTALKTTAVTVKVLLVDNDDDNPDVASYYQAALDAAGIPYDYWDILQNGVLTLNNMKAHDVIVWFTGASYPAPLAPYEAKLAAFLDGGGKLFMSGQDILDDPGGYTSFALNYLHIASWNNNTQNDTGTTLATGVVTSPLTSGLGSLPVDVDAVGMPDYSDWLTLDAVAQPAFRDAAGRTNALTADTGTYQVIFLAFPYEALTDECDRFDVMARSAQWLLGGAIAPVCGAITGTTNGFPNVTHTFTATVRPDIAAALPLTYTWQATDLGSSTYSAGAQTTITYTWSTMGHKMLDLTAMNGTTVGARAWLSGAEETPPVTTTTASGVAIFAFDPATRQLSYEMATYGVTATAAHIHRGAVGVAGPVAYPLTTPAAGSSVGAVTLSVSDEALLLSGGLYVNVHSAAYPGGEIRGQIYVTGGGHVMLSHDITIDYPVKVYLPLVRR